MFHSNLLLETTELKQTVIYDDVDESLWENPLS